MISFVVVPVEYCLSDSKGSFDSQGIIRVKTAVMRCLLMWSISGITVVMLGVPHKKNKVVSLKISKNSESVN